MALKRKADDGELADLEEQISAARAEHNSRQSNAAFLESKITGAASFPEAKALREQADEERWQASRITKRLTELETQLRAANERRRARELHAKISPHAQLLAAALQEFFAALAAAASVGKKAMMVFETARKELGDESLNRFRFPATVSYNGLVREDLAAGWSKEMQQRLDAMAGKVGAILSPAPAVTEIRRAAAAVPGSATAQTTQQPSAPGSLQHRIIVAGGIEVRESTPQTAARAPDDNEPLCPGQVRVEALRAGWSASDSSPQCSLGQKVRLDAGIAEQLVAGAAPIRIVERFAEPASPKEG